IPHEPVLVDERIEAALRTVMPELNVLDVVGSRATLRRLGRDLIRRDVDELGLFVDEPFDQPRTRHPVDPRMLARDPLHGCPPQTPAAVIGSIAEVTEDFLIYVVGALLAAVIVAAVLYWRYPWSRLRG